MNDEKIGPFVCGILNFISARISRYELLRGIQCTNHLSTGQFPSRLHRTQNHFDRCHGKYVSLLPLFIHAIRIMKCRRVHKRTGKARQIRVPECAFVALMAIETRTNLIGHDCSIKRRSQWEKKNWIQNNHFNNWLVVYIKSLKMNTCLKPWNI